MHIRKLKYQRERPYRLDPLQAITYSVSPSRHNFSLTVKKTRGVLRKFLLAIFAIYHICHSGVATRSPWGTPLCNWPSSGFSVAPSHVKSRQNAFWVT